MHTSSIDHYVPLNTAPTTIPSINTTMENPNLALSTIIPNGLTSRYEDESLYPECTGLVNTLSKARFDPGGARFTSQKPLEESASKGCHMCHLFVESISSKEWAKRKLFCTTNGVDEDDFVVSYWFYWDKESYIEVKDEYLNEHPRASFVNGGKPAGALVTKSQAGNSPSVLLATQGLIFDRIRH